MSKFVRSLVLLVVCSVAAGCMSISSMHAPNAAKGTGAIIFDISLHNAGCIPNDIVVGELEPSNNMYKYSTNFSVSDGVDALVGKTSPVMREIKAGKYGILQYTCTFGGKRRMVLTHSARMQVGRMTYWLKPIATFEVQAGEIVNIGKLRSIPDPNEKPSFWTLSARYGTPVLTDIPQAELQKFVSGTSSIKQPVVTRLMVLEPISAIGATPPRPGVAAATQ